jgi:hypothetical protein
MMKGTIQLAPVKSGTLASILAGGHCSDITAH